MEFGDFTGGTVGPRPWAEHEPLRLQRDVEAGVAADRAGFESFWAPEHHALEVYSHCSSSHLMCLAVGMRTERIRLVTGIFNICPEVNHPVRVAEQIALIDVLTNGRIELGTGRGSGSTEVGTFGLTNEETRERWDEAIRAIPKMWTQDLFSWEGKHFSVPERAILPKPVQKPHPPLWVTASNPPTVELAARYGLGAAMFSFSDPAKLAPLVETYKKTIRSAEPVGAFVHDKILALAPLFCLPDGDEARRLYAEGNPSSIKGHFSIYFDTIPQYAARLADEPRPMPQSRIRELIRAAYRDPELKGPVPEGSIEPDFLYQNGICVGDPDDVARTVARYRDVGLDQVVFIPAVGWHIPHEKSLESIALAGEKVLPKFR